MSTTVTRAAAVAAALVFVPAAFAADPPAAVRWRTDYTAARKEAADKGVPILLDIGTADCFYCRKLDATTLLDPGIAGMLAGQFIPLKIDGNAAPDLVKALKVQMYPTLVLAGADGKIHATLQGYQTADQLRDHMKRSLTTATAQLVVNAAAHPDRPTPARAKELLAMAKESFAKEKYASCLDHAGTLATTYADQPEGLEAIALAAKVKTDPVRLAAAGAEAAEKAAELLLAVADAHAAAGRPTDAADGYEKVVHLTPNGDAGTTAKAKLAKLKPGPTVSFPATYRKP